MTHAPPLQSLLSSTTSCSSLIPRTFTSTMQTLEAACYTEASIGVNAIGYALDFDGFGVRLYLPNMFGAGPFLSKQ